MRWGPIPLHCLQSNSMFPIKNVNRVDLLDGIPESPQEHCHKTRRTLMSPQERKIAQCTPNQLEMRPISPSIGSITTRQSISYRTSFLTPFRKLERFPETTISRIDDHHFSRAAWGMFHAPHIISGWELFLSSTEEVSQLATSTSREAFPQK